MRCFVVAIIAFGAGCGAPNESAPSQAEAQVEKADPKVGYDVRKLRPRSGESVANMFERQRTQALADGKQVAVLFSAAWCEPCKRLELELGNMHPAQEIGNMRVFEFQEEDWESVTRMNEVNALRKRWYEPLNSYPVLVVLDSKGEKIEEMKEAVERMEAEGIEPTVARWFKDMRAKAT